MSAFFYAFSISPAYSACVLPEQSERVRIDHVIDGDTIKLEGGTSVRLLGVNTPELGRKGQPAQPLAEEATNLLRSLLGGEALLVDGDTPQDRYGRRLSHVFSTSGLSAEEVLIRRGLGFFIGSDPATAMAPCLRQAEQEARLAKQGIWSETYWKKLKVDSKHLHAGFVLLQGRVLSVERTRHAIWLETDGDVVLKVDRKLMHRFPDEWWQQLTQKTWLIKGWMVDRKGRQGPHKRWLMRLMYPDMLVPLD